jgi:hypothetical protein
MLTFTYLNSAGAPTPVTVNSNGQQFQVGINYQMVLTGAILADIQMNSSFSNTTPGSASSTKNAQIGAGPTFISTVSDQGLSTLPGNHSGALIPTTGTGTWTITDGISLQAQTGGSATQSSFQNLFTLSAVTTATPDAGTVLSIGTGLICLGLIGRRKLKLRD